MGLSTDESFQSKIGPVYEANFSSKLYCAWGHGHALVALLFAGPYYIHYAWKYHLTNLCAFASDINGIW